MKLSILYCLSDVSMECILNSYTYGAEVDKSTTSWRLMENHEDFMNNKRLNGE